MLTGGKIVLADQTRAFSCISQILFKTQLTFRGAFVRLLQGKAKNKTEDLKRTKNRSNDPDIECL